jgi:hypothetical protein
VLAARSAPDTTTKHRPRPTGVSGVVFMPGQRRAPCSKTPHRGGSNFN